MPRLNNKSVKQSPALALVRKAVGWIVLSIAGPALAAGADDWNITGDIARACTISFDCESGDRCLQLRLDDRSTAQDTALIRWQCNYAISTATMEFSSQNQSMLRNSDDEIGLPYRASYTGDQQSGFADQPLATPVRTQPSPQSPNVDVSGMLQIRIGARDESLFAGRYTDRITVTITPDSL